MRIFSFIRLNRAILIFFAVIIATVNLIILISTSLQKSLDDLWYLNFLICTISILYAVLRYTNWYQRFKPLKEALNSNSSIDSAIPEDESFYSLLLRDIITNKNIESELQQQELKKSMDEINDYIMKWVHEIKIPVSVCELILERSEDCALVNEIQAELEKIKFLTNQVLYISRASNYYEDLSVRYFSLDKVVKNSIKRNSTLMISKNIEINISNMDIEILSDEKWISYILDQILHNAYKYLSQNGRIDIGASFDEDHNVMLSIRDKGVGILPKDISRIFDKSYTGNNKSNLSKSTGMGLYITQKMLDKLGHKIEVKSEPNVFTEFTITFYRISDYILNIAGENNKTVPQ